MEPTPVEDHRTLKHLREAMGLSQDKLSALSGVSWATIAKLELGDHTPNFDTLKRLATILGNDVLGVDYGWKRDAKKIGKPRKLKGGASDQSRTTDD